MKMYSFQIISLSSHVGEIIHLQDVDISYYQSLVFVLLYFVYNSSMTSQFLWVKDYQLLSNVFIAIQHHLCVHPKTLKVRFVADMFMKLIKICILDLQKYIQY